VDLKIKLESYFITPINEYMSHVSYLKTKTLNLSFILQFSPGTLSCLPSPPPHLAMQNRWASALAAPSKMEDELLDVKNPAGAFCILKYFYF
jgi:hypothetical protein